MTIKIEIQQLVEINSTTTISNVGDCSHSHTIKLSRNTVVLQTGSEQDMIGQLNPISAIADGLRLGSSACGRWLRQHRNLKENT